MSMGTPENQQTTLGRDLGLRAFVVVLDGGIRAMEENIDSYRRSMKVLILGGVGWISIVGIAWIFVGKSSVLSDPNLMQIMTTGVGLLPLAASLLPYKVIGPERFQLARFRGVKAILEKNEPLSPEEYDHVKEIVLNFLRNYLGGKSVA